MFRASRRIQAVILDWSGTVCDKYVIAPAVVFKDVFQKHGVDVTMEECRKPMGLRKDLHIKSMLFDDTNVYRRWSEKYGRAPEQQDVDNLFKDFVPMQLNCLEKYSGLIPGAKEAITKLSQTAAIGSTTGFTRSMVDILEKDANKQGVFFDCTVAGDEVVTGWRPYPHMVYKNMDILGIQNPKDVVKVDDTVGGIGEGIHAGCWSVGVSRYSNYMDIDSYEHEDSLTEEEIDRRHAYSRKKLEGAGAHLVVDSIAELPEAVDIIQQWISEGKTP